MTFIREPSKCPICSERTYTVTESRTPGSTKTYLRRRRKRCTHCGHKDTTYEITAKEYEEYLVIDGSFSTHSRSVSKLSYNFFS